MADIDIHRKHKIGLKKAKVAAQRVAYKNQILFVNGLVQTELRADALDTIGRRAFAEHDHGGVARDQAHETKDEQRDTQQH